MTNCFPKGVMNLGYVYENMVAQALTAKGYNLFYYTMKSETSNHLYEIDFLLPDGKGISPVEVKSGQYRSHESLDAFSVMFSQRIRNRYVVHTKEKGERHSLYSCIYGPVPLNVKKYTICSQKVT